MKKYILIIFMILSVIILSAEDLTDDTKNTIKLDIDSAIERALKYNLSLKNSELDLINKKFSLASSWNQFIPNASLSASIGHSDSFTYDNTIDENNTNNNSKNTLSAGFSTSLSLNAKMIFNIYQSVIDWKKGVISLKQVKANLTNSIKKYYYNLVILKEQISLIEKQIENTKERYDASLIKLNNGMISELEKLKNEYAYKSLLPDISKAINDYQTNLLSFKQLIGIKNDFPIELTSSIPEIPSIDYEKIINMPMDNNLDIQLLTQQLKSDQNTRNTYIAGLTPSLNLSYSLSSSFNKDPFNDAWFDNNNWDSSGAFKLSVSIPLDPLFPFSETQTNIIKSRNNIIVSSNNIKDAVEKKKIELVTAIMKLKEIDNSIDSLVVNVDLAEKTYELQQKSYSLGSKNFLELKDAENSLFEAKLKLLNAKYDYFTNLLDIKYILNIDDLNN